MTTVRDFLKDMARGVVHGKRYAIRIDIEDGGYNSYIGFDVYLDDWKSKGEIQGLRLYRHTNSIDRLSNEWSFVLGSVFREYHLNPGIPLRFSSYGKALKEAEAEARGYFAEIEKLIQKRTSDYKIEAANSAEEEKKKLLARLAELENSNEF